MDLFKEFQQDLKKESSDEHWLIQLIKKRYEEYQKGERVIQFSYARQVTPRRDYLRVSTVSGGCMRKAYYKLNKAPENPNFNYISGMRMDFGSVLHEYLQALLRDDLENVEQRYYFDDIKLTGQIDGKMRGKKELFEIKTTGLMPYYLRNIFDKPKKDHIKQTNWYMHKLGLEKANILYVNRNVDMFFGNYGDSVQRTINESLKQAKEFEEHSNPLFTVMEAKYDPELIEEQIAEVEYFWKVRMVKKKPPPKISAKYICADCEFLKHCRGVDKIDV